GGTADRNRSHWSTSKTPSYTKSVSWQHHPFQRTFLVRAIHAICFETGLIITLIPVAMVMLNLTVTEAFFVEIGLVLFFLPYTMLFNWLYDYLRWTFVGRKRSAI
ncbi:PACE efflux transporter, partial [Enterobacter cloacae]|uniref:PACE efflux transporter n=1 Tax=Enterobacter cloacae TaxID=550 RepID=UPI0020050AD8